MFLRFGITVIGISSDGDNRLLSVMKSLTSFDFNQTISTEPNLEPNKLNYIQDTVHIGTKLRNRMLNSSIVLYMGNKVVSIVHIKTLLQMVPKEIHGLVYSDINPEDRQNYNSLQKIMQDRVLNAMKLNVADCDGTIMYLKLCRLITSSFIEPKLAPIERIYNIWYAVFFFRCWKKYIIASDDQSLNANFISNNSYTCVEINAHNIIEIVRKLRSTGEENLFLTTLFASQPCENIFRMMRSMGTINYTKINFWLNELLHMIARVEILNKTIYTCKAIEFPRTSKEEAQNILQTLPSDDEIKETIVRAQTHALQEAALFGMVFVADDIKTPQMKSRMKKVETPSESESESNSDDETLEICDQQSLEVEAASSSLVFIQPDGTTRTVRKSTFIWEQIIEKDKLSSDRLKRVQGSSRSILGSNAKRQKLTPSSSSETNDPIPDGNIIILDEIAIGDWILFDLKNDQIPSNFKDEVDKLNGHLLGLVTGFRYREGKKRTTQYKTNFVSLSQEQGEKKVIVLAIWYSCAEDGLLSQISGNFSIGINSYKRTIKTPTIKAGIDSVSYILPFQYSDLKNIFMATN